MTEPKPELEKLLPQVEVGIEFSPFEYEEELPKLKHGEPGSFFDKNIVIRGVDEALLFFDDNPNPEVISNFDAIIITKQGVIFAHKGEKAAQEITNQHLFQFSIDFEHVGTNGQLEWTVSFPKFDFEASRVSRKVGAMEFGEFRDNQTGKEVTILVPHDLEILKEMRIRFIGKENAKR